MIPFDRDASTADALLTDLYLDAILAGRSLRGEVIGDLLADPADPADGTGDRAGSAAAAPSGRLDPAIRAVSQRLRHDLVRVHPSFRFEDRLATRLAEAALELRVPTAVGAEGHVVPFRRPSLGTAAGSQVDDGLPTGDELLPGPSGADRRELARPILIGGALTSAALSLAGAALVAWRRARPGSPMVRAARAVRDARDAAAAALPFESRRLD